ncbi:iron-sulfur cluster insertion protein ErpA [Desertimonas flava]|uniref:iron-sulfur cluster insertion protein ErpA n=1 Tax=Desertimonas flava TaxID=2064846 RepID=UPI000E350C56
MSAQLDFSVEPITRGLRPCVTPESTGGDPLITLTDNAASKVKELLAAEGAEDLALRVAVRPGGCSGFSYEMFFDGDVAADDEQARFGPDDAVRVIVDAQSAQLLAGATLDYKDGLDQSGFAITNPNATRTCGCGQSFS